MFASICLFHPSTFPSLGQDSGRTSSRLTWATAEFKAGQGNLVRPCLKIKSKSVEGLEIWLHIEVLLLLLQLLPSTHGGAAHDCLCLQLCGMQHL